MNEIIINGGEEKNLRLVHNVPSSEITVVRLCGEGAKVVIDEIFICDSKSEIVIVHEAPNTFSSVFSRGAVRKETVSNAAVKILKGMKNSQSVVKQRFVLLENGAKAEAIPALEIEESDVLASHSSSVSPISESGLFYLQSRGFSEYESKKMLVEAVLSLPDGVKWQG